eukprot:m.45368 g.45368  ORF g.45368 m.45368 type:complete len:1297 (-) comp7215_c1_seq2:20-3910(-)
MSFESDFNYALYPDENNTEQYKRRGRRRRKGTFFGIDCETMGSWFSSPVYNTSIGPRLVHATPFVSEEERRTRDEDEGVMFCDNRVITSKYTVWNFLPINLFEQFRRIANFYFLIMMIIALIPGIAVISPLTSVLPLVFVISVTALKQAYEDYLRHKADNEINNNVTRILSQHSQHHEIHYSDVQVGDIVKVLEGEEFPADLLLLSSSHASNDSFITTANLDGETSLKIRYVPTCLQNVSLSEIANNSKLSVSCSPPTTALYEFEGKLIWKHDGNDGVAESVGVKQMLLKGSRLKNTDYIYGVAVYTGRDTKTALNQPRPKYKFSSVETRMNFFLTFYLIFLLIVCTISVALNRRWINIERSFWPIDQSDFDVGASTTSIVARGFKDWLSFMLLYNWVIPISLYVTLEVMKFANAFIIYYDIEMYDEVQNETAAAKTSDLMEDLGQIKYVFTDKTGTLTENEMVFKHCSVGGTPISVHGYYKSLFLGDPLSERLTSVSSSTISASLMSINDDYEVCIGDGEKKKAGVSLAGVTKCDSSTDVFDDDGGSIATTELSSLASSSVHTPHRNSVNEHLARSRTNTLYAMKESRPPPQSLVNKATQFISNNKLAQNFFECLALCHTVTVEVEGVEDGADGDRKRTLAAASPDEEALMYACEMEQVGYELASRTNTEIILNFQGEQLVYKVLHVCEFNSKRMRMSVLVETPSGEVKLLMKGADAKVLPRCSCFRDGCTPDEKMEGEATQVELNAYSEKGLRTLVVCAKTLNRDDADSVMTRLTKANESIENRSEKLSKVYDAIETEMTLLGITAVEDRLQDGVVDTLQKLRRAGINVWVLTGDKVQTAINISLSAGHFTAQTKQLQAIDIRTRDQVKETLIAFKQDIDDIANRQVNSSYGSLRGMETNEKGHQKEAVDVVLIVDGDTLLLALKHYPLLFRHLSMRCKAVLCCRLSPQQKAAIVRLVKTGSPISPDAPENDEDDEEEEDTFYSQQSLMITLAIGDGANDVAMIREAHIGVGLFGKEGRQAARTSDYSIARFRFLARLLLVHGHYSYLRVGYSVQYFFYKNMIFILPFLFFGPRNLFSAQPLFEQWLLTFWSVLFTSLPIFLFGIFEKDVNAELLMKFPETYSIFERNALMSWFDFTWWTLLAGFQGAVAYYLMEYLTHVSRPQLSLYWLGNSIYTLVLLAVTVVLLKDTQHWIIFTHVGVWLSLIVYFGFVLVSQGIVGVFGPNGDSPGIYWSGVDALASETSWLPIFASLVVMCGPHFAVGFARRLFFPNVVHKIQHALWTGRLNLHGEKAV